MELKEKKVLVAGFGKTGIACTDFLLQRGARVVVNDNKERSGFDNNTIKRYEEKGIEFVFGKHPGKLFLDVDIILISPGIDPRNLPHEEIRKKGIPVISEIELAYQFAEGKIIGVTGTNGKTTVTTLLGELFKKAGYATAVCGNIGFPFITAVNDQSSYDYFIVEISSFQLEAVHTFRAHGGILLNISPDHMDRYAAQEDYVRAKWKIFLKQCENDWAIVNAMQADCWKKMPSIHSRILEFSSKGSVTQGCFLKEGMIYYTDGSVPIPVMTTDMIRLKGMHNVENVMVCIIAAQQEHLDKEIVHEVISTFKGLPHRMEVVSEINGRIFINDSKATNPDAVVKALEGFKRKVIIILGGKDKELDYSDLKESIQNHVKIAMLIGETKHKIYEAVKGTAVKILFPDTLEEAVKTAYSLSEPGDIVLLSPACASFDMFKDYVDRGNTFKRIVAGLV